MPEARSVHVVPEPIEAPTVRYVVTNVAAPCTPQTPDVGALRSATTPEESSGLVLPIALSAFQTDTVRIVVFAAAAEDAAPAYDGVFIESL